MKTYLADIAPTIVGVILFCLFIYIVLYAATTTLYFFFYEDLVEQTIIKMGAVK